MIDYQLLLVAAFLAPIAVYAYVGLVRGSPATTKEGIDTESPESLEHYLLCDQKAPLADVAQSAIGYMLQLSTTFYFVYWGFNYGFANLFYVVGWAVGLFIFMLYAPKLLKARSDYVTLPALIAAGSGTVRKLTAIATFVAFVGVAYVEAYFAADFIAAFLSPPGSNTSHITWWFFFALLVVIATAYTAVGGLWKVYQTDRIQLSIAYLGFALVFSYLLGHCYKHSLLPALTLSALVLSIYVVLFIESCRLRLGSAAISVLGCSVVLIGAATTFGLAAPRQVDSTITIPGLLAQVHQPLGWVTLLGFTIINLLWQFCDASNFQRLASLDLSGLDHEQKVARYRQSIRAILLISPITWGLGIVLGMTIRVAGIVPTETSNEFLSFVAFMREQIGRGDIMALIAVAGFGAAISSIMMSTFDSSVIAATQAVSTDLLGISRYSRLVPLLTGFITLALVFAFVLAHRVFQSASVFVVMAGVYSQIVVLATPVILRLHSRPVGSTAIVISTVVGTTLVWIATFGNFANVPLNVKIVLPILAGVIGSVIPLIPAILSRKASPGARQ